MYVYNYLIKQIVNFYVAFSSIFSVNYPPLFPERWANNFQQQVKKPTEKKLRPESTQNERKGKQRNKKQKSDNEFKVSPLKMNKDNDKIIQIICSY